MTPEPAAEVAPPGDSAPTGAAASAPVLELSADRLSWTRGRFVAEGRVRVVLGPDVLVAERAEGDATSVRVERGTWTRQGATLHFDEATIRVESRSGALLGAVVEPCACADGRPAALRFRATRVDVVDAEVAVVRQGVVEVFRVPLLPVPYWPVILDPRRFRLLLPEVGYGEPGFSARWHGRGGVGDYWVQGGPAWRQDRGVRGEVAIDGPLSVDAVLGYDAVDGGARGAAAAAGGFAGDWFGPPDRREGTGLGDRAALDGNWLGDVAYADDYGVEFVDRGVAYRETRAVAQARGFRLEGWLPDDGSAGLLAFGRFRPEWARGGYAVAPWVGAGVDGQLPSLAGEGAAVGVPVVATGFDARASSTWGWVHAEATVDAAIFAGATGLREGGTFGGVALVEAPMWTEVGAGRVLFWPGVATRLRDEAFASGPQVRAQAVAGKTVLGTTVFVPLAPSGSWPEVALDVGGERLSLHAEAREAVQSAEVRLATDVGGGVGFLHARDTWLGWGDVAVRAGRFVSGLGATLDLAAEAEDPWAAGPLSLEAAVLRVGYDDGCSSLVLVSALAPDRELPDLGMQLVLRK